MTKVAEGRITSLYFHEKIKKYQPLAKQDESNSRMDRLVKYLISNFKILHEQESRLGSELTPDEMKSSKVKKHIDIIKTEEIIMELLKMIEEEEIKIYKRMTRKKWMNY